MTEENKEKTLTIKFHDDDSSLFDIGINKQLNPFQCLALGGYFEFLGKALLNESRNMALAQEMVKREQAQKLIIPNQEITKPM